MATLTYTVGRLVCSKFRNFLDQCKFKGMDIEYIESSGWIERDFMIKGSDQDVLIIKSSLDEFSDSLD